MIWGYHYFWKHPRKHGGNPDLGYTPPQRLPTFSMWNVFEATKKSHTKWIHQILTHPMSRILVGLSSLVFFFPTAPVPRKPPIRSANRSALLSVALTTETRWGRDASCASWVQQITAMWRGGFCWVGWVATSSNFTQGFLPRYLDFNGSKCRRSEKKTEMPLVFAFQQSRTDKIGINR